MAGLSFSGLASGLDTAAIVAAIIDVERQPLRRIQENRDELAQRQALFRDLNTKLLALRDAARSLDNLSNSLIAPASSEELLAFTASSDDESVLVARANGSAAPGSIDVHVEQLATAGRKGSIGFAATSSTVLAQLGNSLDIDYGGTADIHVAVTATTKLSDLVSAINTSTDNDGSVRAQVLFDGTEYRLIIASTETGVANDFTATAAIPAFFDTDLDQPAQDASLRVLGVDITRSSNTIADAIPGVTLELRGTNTPGDFNDVTAISVTRDDEAIAADVQKLVDAYNAVRDFSVQQSRFSEERGAGLLSGDSLLGSVERLVQRTVSGVREYDDNPFKSLSAIGIHIDSGGRLELNRTELAEALDEDPASVRQLLTGDGTEDGDGIATALARALDPIVRPGDGVLAVRQSSFDLQIRTSDRRAADFETRLAAREQSLKRQFASLERLVSALKSQSGFLDGL
jgi:flagellar hook-associated protein 2